MKNFHNLLTRALAGDIQPFIEEFDSQQKSNPLFVLEPEEINLAFIEVNKILDKPEHPQRKHALFFRAFMHDVGIGELRPNDAEYRRLREEAIRLNNDLAMLCKAEELTMVDSIKNRDEIINLLDRAVVLENARAMVCRAEFYCLEGNQPERIILLDKAIALGNRKAMQSRIVMHLGVKSNYTEALRLTRLAESKGYELIEYMEHNELERRAAEEQGVAVSKITDSFFSARRNKPLRPKNYSDSCFSAEQIKEIEQQIEVLEKEVNSSWPYPNKDRKKDKALGLIALIDLSRQEVNPKVVVEQIEQLHPNIRDGLFSTRTADLLDRLKSGPVPNTMANQLF